MLLSCQLCYDVIPGVTCHVQLAYTTIVDVGSPPLHLLYLKPTFLNLYKNHNVKGAYNKLYATFHCTVPSLESHLDGTFATVSIKSFHFFLQRRFSSL